MEVTRSLLYDTHHQTHRLVGRKSGQVRVLVGCTLYSTSIRETIDTGDGLLIPVKCVPIKPSCGGSISHKMYTGQTTVCDSRKFETKSTGKKNKKSSCICRVHRQRSFLFIVSLVYPRYKNHTPPLSEKLG